VLKDLNATPTGNDEGPRTLGNLWERFLQCQPEARRSLVEGAPEFQTWAFSERLGEESEGAASENAAEALDLARISLHVACLADGRDGSTTFLQALAWGFTANALAFKPNACLAKRWPRYVFSTSRRRPNGSPPSKRGKPWPPWKVS
jgi:hypothetical protein